MKVSVTEYIKQFIMNLADLFSNNEFCLNALAIALTVFVSYGLYLYITNKPLFIRDNGDGTETYIGARSNYIVKKEEEQ